MADTIDQERVQEIIKQSPPWYKVPSLIHLYFVLTAPLMTSAAWGFDLSMTNGLQSVARFMENFGNPTGATLGFYGASVSVGGLVACIVGGPLGDRFGRRSLTFAGAVFVIAGVFIEIFSTSFSMFSGGKLLLGFGSNLQQLTAPVLVTELVHPKERVALTSIYNTSIFIGLIIGSWVTFGTYSMESEWSWKIPVVLQIIIPTYQVLLIWFCPESPRWLMSKGRIEESRAIIIKYHGNGVENDLVRAEIQEIIAGIEADKTELKFNKEGIKTILGTAGNRHRLWLGFWTAIGSQCLGSSFIASYLPLILDQVGMTSSKDKTLINGISNIWNWVVALSAAFIIPRVKRRTIFLISTTGMTAAFVVWTALTATYLNTQQSSYGIGVIVVIFIFSFFSAMCWIPLVIAYPLETVTTKQRSIFFAWTMFVINGSAFVASYINPVALEAISWRYYIVQCVFNALMVAIIYFTFVETSGYSLEEIAVIFDGQEDFALANAVVSAGMEKSAEIEEANHTEEAGREKVAQKDT